MVYVNKDLATDSPVPALSSGIQVSNEIGHINDVGREEASYTSSEETARTGRV